MLHRVAKPVSIDFGLSAGRRDPVDPALAVVDQAPAVAQPVGRLDPRRGDVHHAAIGRGEGERLERAVDRRRRPMPRDRPVVSSTFEKTAVLGDVGVVRADADTDIERLAKLDPHGRPGELQSVAGVHVQADVLPDLLDAEPLRRRDVRLDLVREVALGIAELQRREAVAVDGGVDVGRVGVEVLADDQARLAMRLLALADERDIGRERDVAADPLPRVMEGVAGRPHVGPAAGDGVRAGGLVEDHRAGILDVADVLMAFEDPDGLVIPRDGSGDDRRHEASPEGRDGPIVPRRKPRLAFSRGRRV